MFLKSLNIICAATSSIHFGIPKDVEGRPISCQEDTTPIIDTSPWWRDLGAPYNILGAGTMITFAVSDLDNPKPQYEHAKSKEYA
jgi:hypothetical protein